MNREQLEWTSRAAAGTIDETDKWEWCRVLDMFEMYVMKGDESVSPHLVRDGFWESWITLWMMRNIGPGTVFYDVGANTGYYSLLALSQGAQVVSFEPNPTYYEMLLATKERHNLGSWRIHNVALSNRNGSAKLYVPRQLQGSASLSQIDPIWEVSEVTVQVKRADTMFAHAGAGRHLFKIDAEGEEEKIWEGLVGYLNRWPEQARPVVALEYTPEAYSPYFIKTLQDYGRIRMINTDGDGQDFDPYALNFIRDWLMLEITPHGRIL